MAYNILFIEDEQWGVNAYFRVLEKKGFKCTLAQSGNEAIKLLERREFDFICLDVMFPSGELIREGAPSISAGVELLASIRSNRVKNCPSNIKVIVLTAVMDQEIEGQIRDLGVQAYLKKPVEFDTVIRTVESVLNNCRLNSSTPTSESKKRELD